MELNISIYIGGNSKLPLNSSYKMKTKLVLMTVVFASALILAGMPALAVNDCVYHESYGRGVVSYDYSTGDAEGNHYVYDDFGQTILKTDQGNTLITIWGDQRSKHFKCASGAHIEPALSKSICERGVPQFTRISDSEGYFTCTDSHGGGEDSRFYYECEGIDIPYVIHDYQACYENNVYWFDSGACRQELIEDCTGGDVCLDAVCYPTCTPGYTDNYQCAGNWLEREEIDEYCRTSWVENYEYCDYGCDSTTFTCNSQCHEGYTENYRCDGNWLERQYVSSDCDYSWDNNYEYCTSGCSDVTKSCNPYCEEGYLDDYQCMGSSLERNYQYSDCSTEWREIEHCQYGCSGNTCNSGCTPGYISNYQCNGNWLQQEYKDIDCSLEWRDAEYCNYGCSAGACNTGATPYCEDTDGGIVWTVQGNTYGLNDYNESYSKTDYCGGNTVHEYYCSGNDWALTSYSCAYGCSDGACKTNPSCTDECSVWGDTKCKGDEKCTCGYYDSDPCLEWGNCYESSTCDNECDSGWDSERKCRYGDVYRMYTYSDCDEEWRLYDECDYGCSNGHCRYDPYDDYCGNGYCDYSEGETCSNCPSDCGSCNRCGNGYCETNYGETCYNCQSDCGVCQTCGNGICSGGETCSSCPSDCGTCGDLCGNGVCSSGETCASCPSDCGSCTQCGDGICSGSETCSSCSLDCGTCQICGDGMCTGSETCSSCSLDCGNCVTACPVPVGENVEVSSEACAEFKGAGTESFSLTVYNKEPYAAEYSVGLSGPASAWSNINPSTVLVPTGEGKSAQITVSVPEGVSPGLYEMTAIISSGSEAIMEKELYVSVAEEDTGATGLIVLDVNNISSSPTGAAIAGEIDLFWIIIGVFVVADLLLVAIVLRRKNASVGNTDKKL